MASLIGRIENLIVKDGEIKGQTKADWMSRCEIRLGNLRGILISLQGLIGRLLAPLSRSEFGEITMIISFPLNRVVR